MAGTSTEGFPRALTLAGLSPTESVRVRLKWGQPRLATISIVTKAKLFATELTWLYDTPLGEAVPVFTRGV